MAFTCPVLLGSAKPLHALGENTLEEEGAAAFVGRARPSAVSRGAAGFPAGLGQHLRNLPVHVSLALLIPHYLLICFICLLVYGPNHPGCKFLES